MISTKKHIQQLASILLAYEMDDVIVSPGSRNGPLIHTFAGSGKFNTRNIVDERSAAYFALGLAQTKQKPVVLCCSSGTATLNYTPAIAEAFYLKVPLIVLTADRPEYLINIGESQCIVQKNIYRDFIKKEINLPLEESAVELINAKKLIEDCLFQSTFECPGPVHINIPLEEPLHELLDKELTPSLTHTNVNFQSSVSENEIKTFVEVYKRSEKILILAGQQNFNSELDILLNEAVETLGTVVLTEHLSNLKSPVFCRNIDTLMAALLNDKIAEFQPNLLISFGGQFVSKSLKQFLRKYKPEEHWHISKSGEKLDTYQSLTHSVKSNEIDFLKQVFSNAKPKGKDFLNRWKNKESQVINLRNKYLTEASFSDLKVFEQIHQYLPENSILHLGNSTPVRYVLLFDAVKNVNYFGNRGTSGIDGSISTAVGYACESEKSNTIIVGDLSFFYDSNAFWNKYIRTNLRIIVVNNGGGNIFGLIKGPSDSPAFKEHFFTENNFPVKGIAATFNLDYFKAENESELKTELQKFYSSQQNKAAILEIFTNAEINTEVFRGLFKFVKD